MEGSWRSTARVGHLCFPAKNKQKKKMQSQFAVKEYIKLLQFHYNFVPWEKPVASVTEMEQ